MRAMAASLIWICSSQCLLFDGPLLLIAHTIPARHIFQGYFWRLLDVNSQCYRMGHVDKMTKLRGVCVLAIGQPWSSSRLYQSRADEWFVIEEAQLQAWGRNRYCQWWWSYDKSRPKL